MTPAAALGPKSLISSAPAILLFFSLSLFALPALTSTAAPFWPSLHRCFLLLAAFLLASLFVVVAARAAMVTWITLLVLLTFAGNRRRVLVQHRRQITTDVVRNLFSLNAPPRPRPS
ncbi:hypothetical protein LINGRAHAP2_LOCUS20785 [Linum grandiflorum]